VSDRAFYGVNLGGWLLLEKWMTPSLFKGVDAIDEYTFMQTPGAQEKIERHRQTFMTEEDFQWLAEHGVTVVRIPVGYWLFESEAPYTPTLGYLDWAVAMAKKHTIKVLIDLHGAPGSQNGRDHSGKTGSAEWYRHREYRQQTIEILEKIARYYHDEPTVWGIELLNEPKFGIIQWTLRRFYKETYERVAQAGRKGLGIVFRDAFTPRLMTGVIWPRTTSPAMMDVHWYHFLDLFHKWRSPKSYASRIRGRKGLIDGVRQHQPVLIGEWSLVVSGEATHRRPEFDSDDFMKKHAALQLDAYAGAAGWFYWSYKTEGVGVWNFRSLVERGIISLQ